ncbi:MAG TPA: BON domain-containing protein [Pyrinomonadaceae bacterium]|jgi:hypothetical protein
MSQEEERQRRSRVVVETPTARREVVQTQTTTHVPEKSGFSTGMVAAVALTAIAATAIIFLFLMNREDDTRNTNVSVTTQATPIPQPSVIIQQPAVQPTPIIIEQPSTISQPAPVIIQQPAPDTTTTSVPPATASAPAASVPDDSAIQTRLSKTIQDDSTLAATDIIATFSDGKATLTGTVDSSNIKSRAERLAMTVKGVRRVDNQIVVSGGGAAATTTTTP